MKCARCQIDCIVTIAPTSTDCDKYRKKEECPQCHERIFSFVTLAAKVEKELPGVVKAVTLPPNKDNAKLMGKDLNCERCSGKTDILYALEMSDELVCGLCKSELAEHEALRQRFQATGC